MPGVGPLLSEIVFLDLPWARLSLVQMMESVWSPNAMITLPKDGTRFHCSFIHNIPRFPSTGEYKAIHGHPYNGIVLSNKNKGLRYLMLSEGDSPNSTHYDSTHVKF